jgi:hypothetical protein
LKITSTRPESAWYIGELGYEIAIILACVDRIGVYYIKSQTRGWLIAAETVGKNQLMRPGIALEGEVCVCGRSVSMFALFPD